MFMRRVSPVRRISLVACLLAACSVSYSRSLHDGWIAAASVALLLAAWVETALVSRRGLACVAVLPAAACLFHSVSLVGGPCVRRDAPLIQAPVAVGGGGGGCVETFVPLVLFGGLWGLLLWLAALAAGSFRRLWRPRGTGAARASSAPAKSR